MKSLSKALMLLLFVTTFSSCYDLIEEIWVERDGSVIMEYKLDLGKAVNEESTKMMMSIYFNAAENMSKALVQEFGGEVQDFPDFSEIKNADFDQVVYDTIYHFGSSPKMNIDSIEFLLAQDEALQLTPKKRRVAAQQLRNFGQNTSFRVHFDLKASICEFSVRTKANSMEELGELKNLLLELGEAKNTKSKPIPDFLKSPIFEMTANNFTRTATNFQTDSAQSANPMMKDASFITIYHFPNKVKQVSNPNATILSDKKTVKTTVSFYDLENRTGNVANEIRF
jgi:hypothetical protein